MAADESDYRDGIWQPSPNFGWTAVGASGRSDGTKTYAITAIVMHGTAGLMPGCLDWLRTPVSKASATYLISRDGLVHQLVRESDVAWTSGDVEAPSVYLNGPDPNLWSIGIEHEMPNGNTGTLTPVQQAASIALITDLRRRHGPLPLIPHSAIAPQSRAHCPGDAFPLAQIDQQAHPLVPRTFPHLYRQRDARWSADTLGTAVGATVGQYGCLVSSMAMLAEYHGHANTTPGALNTTFTSKKVYVQDDLLNDDALARVVTNIKYVRSEDYTGKPADLGRLSSILSDPSLSVILELDFDSTPNDGVQTHFVAAAGCVNGAVSIADSWYGGLAAFTDHYGAPAQVIQKYIVYRGPVLKAAPTPVAGKKYAVLVDMRARRAAVIDQVFDPEQMVYAGATLDGTGRVSDDGWVQVTAGGRSVWLLGANLKAVA